MSIFKRKKKDLGPWEGITLGQFMKLKELNVDKDCFEKTRDIYKIVFNKDIEEIPLIKLKDTVSNLKFLEEEIPSVEIKKFYLINDTRYDLSADITRINAGQYIDYSNYTKEPKDTDLRKVLSVVLIPHGRKYNDGYDMSKVIDDMNYISIKDANAIAFFLQKQSELLSVITLPYLEEMLMETGMEKRDIQLIMDGVKNMESSLMYFNSVKRQMKR